MNTIYKPKGAAAEYGDYAVNIYTGCPHRCYYCFAPGVLHRDREAFHSCVGPRKDIVTELRRKLEREKITGKLVHLCFTCDPYPTGYDTTTTREVIQTLKEYGNHVQILTKGDGSRDFDLLDGGDWYGVTISGADHESQEPGAIPEGQRLGIMQNAPCRKWISFEPVIHQDFVLTMLSLIDVGVRVKIGKLNYHPSDINWAQFGREAERICQARGMDYYIKDTGFYSKASAFCGS